MPKKHTNGSSIGMVDREKLFNAHIEGTYAIVSKILPRLPTFVVSSYREDLKVVALTAMWKATERFDSSLGISFLGWAYKHIQGAVLDELRKLDPCSRKMRSLRKKIMEEQKRLSVLLGRDVSYEESCISIGISPRNVGAIKLRTEVNVVSLDLPLNGDGSSLTLRDTIADSSALHSVTLERQELYEQLKQVIEELPERERAILKTAFFTNVRLSVIATQFGMTESRMSQIVKRAVLLLKEEIVRSR